LTDAYLRLHHLEPSSRVNGPGLRAVVWVQGCTLGCPGCFNPETHPEQAGFSLSVEQLVEKVIQITGIEGITISGGEPFQQTPALAEFLKAVKANSPLSVLLFSGFTLEEIKRIPHSIEALAQVDVLVAGRYQIEKRLAHNLLGSANKQVYFLTKRYSKTDLETIPEAEILIKTNGSIISTGIDPLV
jgi:anaerobic ribonucleoside-triphosphate reductase activating protein